MMRQHGPRARGPVRDELFAAPAVEHLPSHVVPGPFMLAILMPASSKSLNAQTPAAVGPVYLPPLMSASSVRLRQGRASAVHTRARMQHTAAPIANMLLLVRQLYWVPMVRRLRRVAAQQPRGSARVRWAGA